MVIDNAAIVGKDAKIGVDVKVGPFAVVEDGAEIGDGCEIASHAIVRAGSVLGKKVFVDSFAVIGGLPQSIGFDAKTPSGVVIGDGTVIREGMTIHRSMYEGGVTRVGKNCFLMANSHVAHDCELGNSVILANGVLLAGHISIGDNVFIGGNAVLHQNVRIGEGVLIAGSARLHLNVPPFLMSSETNDVHGLNLIGLKRRGYGQEEISDLKKCFKAIFNSTAVNVYELAAAAKAEGLGTTEPGKRFLGFFDTKGKRGCVNSKNVGKSGSR